MSGDAVDPHSIFPGSRAAANFVGWIDRLLLELRDGRIKDALAAREGETWRTPVNLATLPKPILEQVRESLAGAADALAHEPPAVDEAEAALLVARSRFMPGA